MRTYSKINSAPLLSICVNSSNFLDRMQILLISTPGTFSIHRMEKCLSWRNITQ